MTSHLGAASGIAGAAGAFIGFAIYYETAPAIPQISAGYCDCSLPRVIANRST